MNTELVAPDAALPWRLDGVPESASQMTNDLLDATRTELKHFSLELMSAAVDQLTREIADRLRPAIADPPIEVSAEAALPSV